MLDDPLPCVLNHWWSRRQLVAFAMDGVWGAGVHMLAEHAAHDLKHKNDLAKDKAVDVFETLDIQAAMCVAPVATFVWPYAQP